VKKQLNSTKQEIRGAVGRVRTNHEASFLDWQQKQPITAVLLWLALSNHKQEVFSFQEYPFRKM